MTWAIYISIETLKFLFFSVFFLFVHIYRQEMKLEVERDVQQMWEWSWIGNKCFTLFSQSIKTIKYFRRIKKWLAAGKIRYSKLRQASLCKPRFLLRCSGWLIGSNSSVNTFLPFYFAILTFVWPWSTKRHKLVSLLKFKSGFQLMYVLIG